jgi:hypothetical protein
MLHRWSVARVTFSNFLGVHLKAGGGGDTPYRLNDKKRIPLSRHACDCQNMEYRYASFLH